MGDFKYPYTDFHEMNTDWIIEQIPKIKESEEAAEAAQEAAETAQGKAEDAQEAAETAQEKAEDAQEAAETAQGRAEDAQEAAESARDDAEDYRDQAQNVAGEMQLQVNALQARVDNIVPDGTQTAGNTELIDVRVGYSGYIYDSAGDAVRGQVEDIIDGLTDVVMDQNISPNMFDGDFDESGYINITDGSDASSANFKRTSKYYPIVGSGTTIYNKCTPSSATFVACFYDTSNNYLGYLGDNASRTLPAGATKFRIYTDVGFTGQGYIGFTDVTTIPEYGYNFTLKDESIEISKLSANAKNNYNMIVDADILDDTYLQYNTGSVYTNIDEYRCSPLIEVDASTDYYFGLFNDGNGATFEYNAMSVAFYDSSENYISGIYSSGANLSGTGAERVQGQLKFTTPATCKYIRLGTNDSEDPQKWMLSSSLAKYGNRDKLSDDILTLNLKLQGKNIAFFGDSIIGNTRDRSSVPAKLSVLTGANVSNFGFGGCRMSVHAAGWDNCSMYRLADDIYNQSFSALVSAINDGWSGMPGYFTNTVAFLAEYDFSKCDILIISYGTNDYREETSVLDNPSNKFDTSTVCGALRYSIKQILSRYPNIQIFVTDPVFRTFFEEGTYNPEEYSDTADFGSGTLIDYANAFKSACEDMNVPFIDLYHLTSFNPYTRLNFFPADDGTHPNSTGRNRIAEVIAKNIL